MMQAFGQRRDHDTLRFTCYSPAMLHEVRNVRQIPGEGKRRWFSDQYFDLIVWYEKDGSLLGFQLCYDKFHKERAVTWRRGIGFSHEKVDDGEGVPGQHKSTPILVPDGLFDAAAITERFRQESGTLDPDISTLVIETLKLYPGPLPR
jgi:hypothetical protein